MKFMAAAGGSDGAVGESDKAVMTLLRLVNELYAENQRGAKSMRKGFLDMAKARQSMGRGALSALDCREKMVAQMTVEKYVFASLVSSILTDCLFFLPSPFFSAHVPNPPKEGTPRTI